MFKLNVVCMRTGVLCIYMMNKRVFDWCTDTNKTASLYLSNSIDINRFDNTFTSARLTWAPCISFDTQLLLNGLYLYLYLYYDCHVVYPVCAELDSLFNVCFLTGYDLCVYSVESHFMYSKKRQTNMLLTSPGVRYTCVLWGISYRWNTNPDLPCTRAIQLVCLLWIIVLPHHILSEPVDWFLMAGSWTYCKYLMGTKEKHLVCVGIN